uniref:PPIase cyclophilin-type domain-containing protein n=1 Tax=Alexandrium monilatum TaxID=311494 RepID=A0A7S4V502_9DINO|mmetsp:Transcript_30793/g.91477  ORF Transcript_30793/g.91477 Transcript_30793/m.91477 type:complete len:271 (+) Transcript_30793:49-861(+)
MVTSEAAFSFTVPPCGPKAKLRVTAPDGAALQIPLPQQAAPGDELHLAKGESGKWGLTRIVKGSAAAEAPAAAPQATGPFKLSLEDVERDLAGPSAVLVQLETTQGPLRLKLVPEWAPLGVERFLRLVDENFYREVPIYRGIPNFLLQFGVVKDPIRMNRYDKIPDDPLRGVPYLDGMVGFAAAGSNTRTCTVCLFLGDVPGLGQNSVETPIGRICPESMERLHSLHLPGDIPQCGGTGPDPQKLAEEGNDYIATYFLDCDFIVGASRVR